MRGVFQSERDILVIANVGVVVVGGTTAGVAAAVAADRHGVEVFLVAPRLYLGEDMVATLRLALPPDPSPSSPLAERILSRGSPATPGHVKAALAEALLKAGVAFRFGSYVTDVLRGQDGEPCGVVMANRGGRQAIVARVIIDATDHAWVCRMAGCTSASWPSGKIRFERTVLKDTLHTLEFDVEMRDLSFAPLAEAEQTARDLTPTEGVLRAAETLFCVPPVPIRCGSSGGTALTSFRPRGHDRLFVLSGCADLPRREMATLLQPTWLMETGARIGQAAAHQAKTSLNPERPHVPIREGTVRSRGDIRETLTGGRPVDRELPAVPCADTAVPVLASVDVVVVGGGTAGAAAAIAAARRGARTLVIEYQAGLGGVGTLGLIGKPYHGRRRGFAKEVPFPTNIEMKMAWYRREIRDAGGTIWLGALGCGAYVESEAVKGVVVCTPEGRGVVLADVVIDATGNADVAVAAGADAMFGTIEKGDIALQGTGLSARDPDAHYANSDVLLVDEADTVDVWRALTSAQLAKRDRYDIVSLIQSRERRRVVGDFVMRYVDQVAQRTYPDAVVLSGSDYDSHGYPSSPFFGLLPHDDRSRKANHPAPGGTCLTPYRCLLPRGLDNILVVGLGISMDRDASAMVRMQLDLANQGYAAGVAASMAAERRTSPRDINVRALQRHLVEVGNLPADVVSHEDSFPLSVEAVRGAVAAYGNARDPHSAGKPLAVILTHSDIAHPLVEDAYQAAEGRAKRLYAQVLAVLGDPIGVPVLIDALRVAEWDPKIYQGRMADYAHLPTPVDALVLALGYAGDCVAVPAILAMVDRLDATFTLSHHRSAALALERLADPRAAKPLADLLKKPGMCGYVMTSIPEAGKLEVRTESLREITLARALYRCGDFRGLGKTILEQYRHDLRGLFARHADDVLRAG